MIGSCIQLLYNLYPDTPKIIFCELNLDFYKTADKRSKPAHEDEEYIRRVNMKNDGNIKC